MTFSLSSYLRILSLKQMFIIVKGPWQQLTKFTFEHTTWEFKELVTTKGKKATSQCFILAPKRGTINMACKV